MKKNKVNKIINKETMIHFPLVRSGIVYKGSDESSVAFKIANTKYNYAASEVDARVFQNVIKYKLKKDGILCVRQRAPIMKKAYNCGAWMTYNDKDSRLAIERNAKIYGKTKVEFGIRMGQWSFIIAISSNLIAKNDNGMLCMWIPVTEEDIAMFADDIQIVDGQHRLIGMTDEVLGNFVDLDEISQFSFNATFHVMVDPTEEEINDTFLSANWYSTKVSTALSQDIMAALRKKSVEWRFAYDVLNIIASSDVDLGDDIGRAKSEIYCNINFGNEIGEYNAYKLAQALSHPAYNIYNYAVEKYMPRKNVDFDTMRDEDKAFLLCKAASDVSKYMYAVQQKNEMNGGKKGVFGEPKSQNKKRKKTAAKKHEKVNIEVAEVEIDENARVGGMGKSTVYYIFGTMIAVLRCLDKKKKPHTIANMKEIIDIIYQHNGIGVLDECSFVGKGGGDVFNRAAEDSNAFIDNYKELLSQWKATHKQPRGKNTFGINLDRVYSISKEVV